MEKQTIKNIVFQLFTFVMNIGISLVLTPYIVKNVGIEAFGFVGLANSFVQYIQIITVAINSMLARFISISIHNKKFDDANKYYTSALYGNIVVMVILSPIIMLFILYIDQFLNISSSLILNVKLLWIFIFLQFVVSLFSSFFNSPLVAINRLDFVSKSTAISYVVRIIVLLLLFHFFPNNIFFIGMSSFIVSVIPLFSLVINSKKQVPAITIRNRFYSYNYLKELMTSGFWSSISKLSSILASGMDLLIANIFIGQLAMGVLSVAKTIPILIISIINVISSAITPYITINYAKNKNLVESIRNIISYIGVITSVGLSIFIVLSRTFYSLWIPNQDIELISLLSTISVIYLIFVLPILPLNGLFISTNNIKIPSISVFVSGFLTLVTELTIIFLVDDMNIKLLAIVASSAIYELFRGLIFLPIYSAHILKEKWFVFYKQVIKNFFAFAFLLLFFSVINQYLFISNWYTLILYLFIFGITGLIFSFIIVIPKDSKIEILYFLKKSFKKE